MSRFCARHISIVSGEAMSMVLMLTSPGTSLMSMPHVSIPARSWAPSGIAALMVGLPPSSIDSLGPSRHEGADEVAAVRKRAEREHVAARDFPQFESICDR